ncbi:MAG: AAA family ATPase [Caulobacteraceae bacterium]|nr:AAA family ATPase [Caulobacteraceae bacterium]
MLSDTNSVLDAEQALLGCALADPQRFPDVRHLQPEFFQEPVRGQVWKTIKEIDSEGLTPDSIMVADRLASCAGFQELGGAVYLAELIDKCGNVCLAKQHAQLVQEAHARRAVDGVLRKALGALQERRQAVSPLIRALREQLGGLERLASPTGVRPNAAIRADELQVKEFPPQRWLVPDLIPFGLTLLAGPPKVGKSWMALGLVNAVSTGADVLGRAAGAEGDVLYCALEDNQTRLRERMTAMCGPATWPSRLTFWTDMQKLDEGGLEALEGWVAEQQSPTLIVIDILGRVRRPARPAESVYAYDYESLTPLKRLADQTGVAIVVVHHTRKQEAGDALQEVSGSNGLTGAADSTLILSRRPEGAALYGRGRDLPEFDLALELDESSCRWRSLGDRADVHRSAARRRIVEAVEHLGEAGPAKIAAYAGRKEGTVRAMLGKMTTSGELQKRGRGKYRLGPAICPVNIANDDNMGDHPEAAPAASA